GGAIDGVEEPDIYGVEEIECFGDGFHVQALGGLESPGDPEVHRLVGISLEGVARLQSYAVIVAEDIAVGVKPGKLGEVVGRLQGNNRAKTEIVQERMHMRGAINRGVQHKSLAHAVRRDGAFGPYVLAVLR